LYFQIDRNLDIGKGNLLPQSIQKRFVDAEASRIQSLQGIIRLAEMGVCQSEVALVKIQGSLEKGGPGLEKVNLIFSGNQSGIAVLKLLQALFLLGGCLTAPMPQTSQIKGYSQGNSNNHDHADRFRFVHYQSSFSNRQIKLMALFRRVSSRGSSRSALAATVQV